MQVISSNSKRKTDYRLNILVLQIVAVAIIMLTAFIIRLFGGDIYNQLSRQYHEKFDDITYADEVLKPQNKVSESESQISSSEVDTENDSVQESELVDEYDEVIDSGISGNLTDNSQFVSTTASAGINSLSWPVLNGRISSKYGFRTHPITKKYSMHNGLDIAANQGADIYAAYHGEVTSAGYSSSYGYYLIISHDDNMQTLYAHCSKLLVSEGDRVERNERIALVGSTGNSTGPHLHFEVRVGSYRLNPQWLLCSVEEV